MPFSTDRLLLLVLVVVHGIACRGQVKPHTKPTERNALGIGRPVSALDDQIWVVFQDAKGNFWFGSKDNGIFHFDGTTLQQLTTADGLLDNAIRGVQEDQAGNIYVETPRGINKFDGIKFTTLEVLRTLPNDWKLAPEDLWFNCNGNAHHVYRFDGEQLYELQLPRQAIEQRLGIDESATPYSPYTVFGIAKDRRGHLWLGTVLAGAFRFDGARFLWIGEKELSRLADGREPGVRSILEDREGNIWLSNFKTKYVIAADASGYQRRPAADLSEEMAADKLLYFNAGLADQNGDLWMVSYGGGVWKYDGATLSNFEISNAEAAVLLIDIYQDRDGTIWLGTDNDGVYRQTADGFEKFKPKG
ncbi:MAG: two-component regulator propeller domain-containing protein [Bacteroidota bacterium]